MVNSTQKSSYNELHADSLTTPDTTKDLDLNDVEAVNQASVGITPSYVHEENIAPIDLDIESIKAMQALKAQVTNEITALPTTTPSNQNSTQHQLTLPTQTTQVSIDNQSIHSQVALTALSLQKPPDNGLLKPNFSDNARTEQLAQTATLVSAPLTKSSTSTNSTSVPTPPTSTNLPPSSPPYMDIDEQTTILPDSQDIEPDSASRRFVNGLLVGLVYAIIGLIIDWLVNLVKIFSGAGSAEMVWLFLPILGCMGLVFGALFGTKALNVIFGIFRVTSTENNPSNEDDIFSTGLLKAVGIGLAIGVVAWLLMMLIM